MGQNYYGAQSSPQTQTGQSYGNDALTFQAKPGYTNYGQYLGSMPPPQQQQMYGPQNFLPGLTSAMQGFLPQAQGQGMSAGMPQIPPQMLLGLLAQKFGGGMPPQGLGGLPGALSGLLGQVGGSPPLGAMAGQLQAMIPQAAAQSPVPTPQSPQPMFASPADEAAYQARVKQMIAQREAHRPTYNPASWGPLQPFAESAANAAGSWMGKGTPGAAPAVSPGGGRRGATALTAQTPAPTGDAMSQILPPQAPTGAAPAQQGWPGLAMIMRQLGIGG